MPDQELHPRACRRGIAFVLVTLSVCAVADARSAGGGGGRQSPASLDLDTGGCRTTFVAPTCESSTSWTLDKSVTGVPLPTPEGDLFTFEVVVTEGPTSQELVGSGVVRVTNSGGRPTYFSSIALVLERAHVGPGRGDAPGPSGQSWDVVATAVAAAAPACDASGTAATCYGNLMRSPGAEISFFDLGTGAPVLLSSQPTIPVQGADPCLTALVLGFNYRYDLGGTSLRAGTTMRVDLIATFDSGASRGGVCATDLDCDGDLEPYARSVQQRGGFSMPACAATCSQVTLDDPGATVVDPTCVELSSLSAPLHEVIAATGIPGATHSYLVQGYATCLCSGIDVGSIAQDVEDADGDDDLVTLQVSHPGGDAYFNSTITDGGSLDGLYDGWCIDTDRGIASGPLYCVRPYSTYEPAATALVEHPENYDLVNWIFNQGFVGQPSGCGGAYTYGDIQRAFWTLLDDQVSTSGLGAWDQCRVDELIAAAGASGEGFVPAVGGLVAIALDPVPVCDPLGATSAQITIVGVPLAVFPSVGGCTCSTRVENTATLVDCGGAHAAGSPASAGFDLECGGE